MFSIIGAILFLVILVITILVVLGFPFGEFIMGGKFKVFPKKFRTFALFSMVIQVFAIIIVLQAGDFIPLWFSFKTTKYVCFFFATYLSLNTIMNLNSKSKKEKYVMTPLSLIATISFWIAALQM